MNHRDLLNIFGLLCALVLAGVAVFLSTTTSVTLADVTAHNDQHSQHQPGSVTQQDVITDFTGSEIATGAYQRIASTSLIADSVLPYLVEPQRIIMVTASHRQRHPRSFITAHAATFAYGSNLEAIIEHDPDIIVISNATGDTSRIERARELGYQTVDLGPMTGRQQLLKNIRLLGQLVQQPQRAEQLIRSFERRMDGLARSIPPAQRRRAIYAAAYDTQIYGGTVGSSYHDTLVAAGLIDVAAGAFPGQGWPKLRVEDLIRLAPDIIITPIGGGLALQQLPGADQVPALSSSPSSSPSSSSLLSPQGQARGIIEIDSALLGDPGLSMLPAAEEIFHQVYFHQFYQSAK